MYLFWTGLTIGYVSSGWGCHAYTRGYACVLGDRYRPAGLDRPSGRVGCVLVGLGRSCLSPVQFLDC
jgi:hypothetical protein